MSWPLTIAAGVVAGVLFFAWCLCSAASIGDEQEWTHDV